MKTKPKSINFVESINSKNFYINFFNTNSDFFLTHEILVFSTENDLYLEDLLNFRIIIKNKNQ
jgi:hypothetical protein